MLSSSALAKGRSRDSTSQLNQPSRQCSTQYNPENDTTLSISSPINTNSLCNNNNAINQNIPRTLQRSDNGGASSAGAAIKKRPFQTAFASNENDINAITQSRSKDRKYNTPPTTPTKTNNATNSRSPLLELLPFSPQHQCGTTDQSSSLLLALDSPFKNGAGGTPGRLGLFFAPTALSNFDQVAWDDYLPFNYEPSTNSSPSLLHDGDSKDHAPFARLLDFGGDDMEGVTDIGDNHINGGDNLLSSDHIIATEDFNDGNDIAAGDFDAFLNSPHRGDWEMFTDGELTSDPLGILSPHGSSSNSSDGSSNSRRLHPSVRDTSAEYSNRVVDDLKKGNYVASAATVLEFEKGKYDEGIGGSVIYGLYRNSKLIDIGSSSDFTQRIKFRSEKVGQIVWDQEYEVRCLVYLDGIDLETNTKIIKHYQEMMVAIMNDPNVPVEYRGMASAYVERGLDRLGPKLEYVRQMVEMALQRENNCSVVGECMSYAEDKHLDLCIEAFGESEKLEPYITVSEDSSTSSTPVILGMMNWPVSGVRPLCAKPALTQYVGVGENLFNLYDPVYTGEVKGAAKIFAQQPDDKIPLALKRARAMFRLVSKWAKRGKRGILFFDRNKRTFPSWRELFLLITNEFGFEYRETLLEKSNPNDMPGLIVTFQLKEFWIDVHYPLSIACDSRGLHSNDLMLQYSQMIEVLRLHAFNVMGKSFDGEMKAIAGCIHQIHMKDGLHQHPLCATRAVLESVTDEDINATDLCAIPKAPADDPLYPTSKIARRELKRLEVNSNYRRTQDMQLQRRVFCLVTQRLESINLDNLSEVEKLIDDMKDMCRLMPDGSEATLDTLRHRMSTAIGRLSSHGALTKAIESVKVKTARDLQLQDRISCFVSQRLESINLDDLSEVEKLLDDMQDMCRLKPDGSEAKLETIRRRMSTAIQRLSSHEVLTKAIESVQVKGAGRDMQLQRRVSCFVSQRLESINLDDLSEVEKLLDDMQDLCRLKPDGSEATYTTIRNRMSTAIGRLSSHEVLTKAIESLQVKGAGRDMQLQNRISCLVTLRLESINLDNAIEVEKLLDDMKDMCRLMPDGSEATKKTLRNRINSAIGRLSSHEELMKAIESVQVKGAGRDLQLQNDISVQVKGAGRDLQLQNSISCRDMQLQNRISCFVSQRLESINLDNAIEVEKLLDDMQDMCRLMPDGSETTSTTLRHRMNSAIQRLSGHDVLTKAIESVRNRKRCSKQLKKKYGKECSNLRLQRFGQDDIQLASQSKAVVDACLRKHENIQLNDDNIIQISQLQAHAIVTAQHQQLDSESKEQRISLQAEWLVATYHYAQVCGKTPSLECILCGR